MTEAVVRFVASLCAAVLGVLAVLAVALAEAPPAGASMASGLLLAFLGLGSFAAGLMLLFGKRS